MHRGDLQQEIGTSWGSRVNSSLPLTAISTLGSNMSLEVVRCGYSVLHGPDDTSGLSPRQNDSSIAAKVTS